MSSIIKVVPVESANFEKLWYRKVGDRVKSHREGLCPTRDLKKAERMEFGKKYRNKAKEK